jgi:hypothetical protein
MIFGGELAANPVGRNICGLQAGLGADDAAPFDSLQPGAFRAGLLKDGDVGVGLLPEREEVLVGTLGLDGVAGQHQRSAELQVRPARRSDR